MNRFVETPIGTLYLETNSAGRFGYMPSSDRRYAIERDDQGEWLIWAGRFHAIITPRSVVRRSSGGKRGFGLWIE